MAALLLDAEEFSPLIRAPLGGGHDEKWLQALLFAHPGLIPIERIDPGAGSLVPICRELALPKDGASVFLDLLAVTAHGRLVLVECKLWRNPQARREVVAQVLEYAALLRRWSYADLTARLKASLKWSGANPLFSHVRRTVPDLDEVGFVEAVSRSLKSGDFDLVIAGDGIRADLEALAGHLEGSNARLALVEIQLWTDGAGRTVVVPALPLRTEVLRQRVIVDGEGVPLRLEEPGDAVEAMEALADPERAASRDGNRAFWQCFIDSVRFDHPDQPVPRHGGNNWVKIPLPAPARWLTAYRTADEAGLFLPLDGDGGEALFERLAEAAAALRDESGLDLAFIRKQAEPFKGNISAKRPLSDFASLEAQTAWFCDAANRLVNALRPRLSVEGA
ncbi:hypothetical protein [Magnetospirillum sp. 15-1]|uniref:hypothetical protein n=1 Tax=Magnetospirillum sp. 15-1 TaxID=1979370 RepID=UPI001141EFD8|nr:hypothetical protein [Magnetospirillum sp. 15-1]